MKYYSNGDKIQYDIARSFSDKNLKDCPICGTKDVSWEISERWTLVEQHYMFRCPECDCVLDVAQGDVTGLSYTTNSFAGRMKRMHKKDNKTIYVKIDRIGLNCRDKASLAGLEVPLDELKEIAKE